MRLSCQLRNRFLALVAAGGALAFPLAAQGITTAAVSGVVTDEAGQPVEAAQIQVINQSTGVRTGTLTRTNGNYYIRCRDVGGPYF